MVEEKFREFGNRIATGKSIPGIFAMLGTSREHLGNILKKKIF